MFQPLTNPPLRFVRARSSRRSSTGVSLPPPSALWTSSALVDSTRRNGGIGGGVVNALAAEVASALRPEVLDGPFEGPWDLSDFLRYFDEINLPDLGRELVLEAFSNEPARLATAGKKNVAGAFPSAKVGCAIQWEARSTERYFVYRCEYSGDVFLFLCQPIVIEVEYRDARGRRRTYRCTPDYVVARADGVYCVECKTEEELQRDQKRARPQIPSGVRWHVALSGS